MKLNYEKIDIEDIVVNVAYSKCKLMRVSINTDGQAYAVCPKYTSKERFISFIKSKIDWIKKSIYEMSISNNNKKEQMTYNELKDKVLMYVSKYENIMGIKATKISFRNMSTRWGSCTKINGRIRFAKSLVCCNDKFIEYIVVHELSHLIEANHGKKFWNIVKTYVPDYKVREKNKYEKQN